MNRSYGPYVLVTLLYNVLFAAVLLLGRRRRRPLPPSITPLDVILLGLATDRLSRLIAHDIVTRFLREPFVELEQVPGPGGVQTLQEVPEGRGLRRSLGELLTCARCASVWAAALLNYGLWLAPAVARPFIHLLATAGLAELGTMVFEWLSQSSQWYYRQYTVLAPIPSDREVA